MANLAQHTVTLVSYDLQTLSVVIKIDGGNDIGLSLPNSHLTKNEILTFIGVSASKLLDAQVIADAAATDQSGLADVVGTAVSFATLPGFTVVCVVDGQTFSSLVDAEQYAVDHNIDFSQIVTTITPS